MWIMRDGDDDDLYIMGLVEISVWVCLCFEYMHGMGDLGWVRVFIDYRSIVCRANWFSCIFR